jgi:hypothetical protein
MLQKKYRYPGVQPFKVSEDRIFFGRDEELNYLLNLLRLESLVVLHGKSGYGKSSLINAGIIPKVTDSANDSAVDNIVPLSVRFGVYTEDQSESPTQRLISVLNETLTHNPAYDFMSPHFRGDELWYLFKKKQKNTGQRILIILDQFEEFFTYPKPQQEAFKWELSELLFSPVPQTVYDKLDHFDEAQEQLLTQPLSVKLILSIRSDRLSLLDAINDAFPNVLSKTFELKGFTPIQARKAIIKPALITDEAFESPSFRYDELALERILEELSSHNDSQEEVEKIEAFQLQIICQACESQIIEKAKLGEGGNTDLMVTVADLPNFRNLYEDYYLRQLSKLSSSKQTMAKLILEEGLLYTDPLSGGSSRLSVDSRILMQRFLNGEQSSILLEELEDTFLIRREVNSVGGVNYEISHDTLVVPIQKARNERLETEKINQAVQQESSRLKAYYRALLAFSVLIILALGTFFSQELYFAYFSFGDQHYLTDKNVDKLTNIVRFLEDQMVNHIAPDDQETVSVKDPWTSSQIVSALGGVQAPAFVKDSFLTFTQSSLIEECCCWSEVKDFSDMRPTSWVVSAIGMVDYSNRYDCEIVEFFFQEQLEDGSWNQLYNLGNTVPDPKSYGSTYLTSHALRALYLTKDEIPTHSAAFDRQWTLATDRAIDWLLATKKEGRCIWEDFPNDPRNNKISSKSISGLVMHTLFLLGKSTDELNGSWFDNLDDINPDTYQISGREQSDMFYYDNSGVNITDKRDLTRHLVMPWVLIATKDLYESASFQDRVKANIFINSVVKNINQKDLEDNPPFMNAEILIGLKYILEPDYNFR